jgi:3-phenylpropionate/trans-cinnamate dioxygenase ferredoxin reductase subunit
MMQQPASILIIGAGQAGGSAAAALRREGYAGRITLAGAEAYRPYERPPLSKAVLHDRRADDSVYLHKQDFYEGLHLDWMPGVQIEAIDPATRTAYRPDGRTIGFDRCLITTGGRPRSLPGLSDTAPNVVYLRSLDDARRLRERIQPGGRVTVIGGGFLGLEFAAIANEKGMEVTVCEAGEQILGRAAPRIFGDWLCDRFEQAGVRIIKNAAIHAVSTTETGAGVALADGRELQSDFVLIAIGQVPNTDLAGQAGISIDDGIIVDRRCQTTVSGIFSAGDCASHFSDFLGKRVRLESWQNAQEQAIVAAKSMLGLPADYNIVPWFWSDQLSLNIQMLGMPAAGHQYFIRGDMSSAKFSIFGFEEEKLRYAVVVNNSADIRPLRTLLEAGIKVDRASLLDATRPLRETVKTALFNQPIHRSDHRE